MPALHPTLKCPATVSVAQPTCRPAAAPGVGRILLIDDTLAIHLDFRKILIREESSPIEATESVLFGLESLPRRQVQFEVDSAYQGKEGLDMVLSALVAGRPYAVAFVDIRMPPPGLDGVETIARIWAVDPALQIVVCTAYSDYSWAELVERLGSTDGLVILKKPFDNMEVLQLTHALVKKWQLARQSQERFQDLDRRVAQRTRDLSAANEKLLAFSQLGQRLSAAKTVREAALIIVDVADRLVGWTACLCDLYSPEDGTLSHVLAMDEINGSRIECEPKFRQGPPPPLARRAILEGGHLILRDPDAPGPEHALNFGDEKRLAASLLFVPIRNGQNVIGVLSVQNYKPNAYDQQSLETLQALADHCGAAFERLKTEEALRQAQDQLRQAQKLEAIGQLAGGVAHDFNNLLAVIRGNTELVLMTPEQFSPETRDCLSQVTAASDRAAGLTRQLLAFSRKQMMRSQALDVNKVIGNLAKMLKRLIGEHIELKCNYSEGLPDIHADVGMIEQVVVNLVVNARDAMPRGGQVVISTSRARFNFGCTQGHPEARPGEFVSITFRDTGSGIAPEHLPHIFEPFFTTKDQGKGTGLGLATVYGIIKQHQGWVEVASQCGQGATFTVFLPALRTCSAETASLPANSPPCRGTETILLVEDDDSLRLLTQRCLEKFGYTVHCLGSGVDALEFWRVRAPKVDLLLTDVVMPGGVTGRELAEQLRAQNPALKVVFTSGYSRDVLGRNTDFIQKTNSRFLSKPWPANELLTLLRSYLDEK